MGIIITEIIHHLFNPNRISRWEIPLINKPAYVGIGGFIHINAKRRKWIIQHIQIMIIGDGRIILVVCG